MNVYAWKGTNHLQESIAGIFKAETPLMAKIQLSTQGVQLTGLKPYVRYEHYLQKNPTFEDITQFFYQLATLLQAGLPLLTGLNLLASQQPNPHMKLAIRSMVTQLSHGVSFSEAISQQPLFQAPLIYHLIRCGEVSGRLELTMMQLVFYRMNRSELKKTIQQALTYPCVLLCVGVCIALGFIEGVLPAFQRLFHDMHAPLPYWTQLILQFTTHCHTHLIQLLLGGLTLLAFGWIGFTRITGLSQLFSVCLHKVPVLGTLWQLRFLLRFTKTLSLLLSAGLCLLEALHWTAQTLSDPLHREIILQLCRAMEVGEPLSQEMQRHHVFPSFLLQMVMIGEESAQLSVLLDKAAVYYEHDLKRTLQHLSSILEPVMMCTLGLLIGGLVVAIYLPLFQLGSVF